MNNLEQYLPLLHKIANQQCKLFGKEYKDDFIQEGYLALQTASENFKEEKGVPFHSFAYKRVRGAMKDYMKKLDNHLSLDAKAFDEDGAEVTFADLLEADFNLQEQLENQDIYRENLKKSSPINRFIKKKYAEEGMTPQEIIEIYSEMIEIRDVRTVKKILAA